jgi:Ca2+-transporting ATPase
LYGQNGTLTENKMSLNPYTLLAATNYTKKKQWVRKRQKKVIEIAMWASEPVPFDPMEKRYRGIRKQQQMTRADNFP